MGNVLSPDSYLLFDTLKPLEVLKNCKRHLGSLKDAKFIAQKSLPSIFVSTLMFRFYLSDTPLQKSNSVLREKFSSQGLDKVNLLEIISCIITYSSCSVQEKVQMAFEVFDFDKDSIISRAEMRIMCLSFMRGLAIITGSTMLPSSYCEELAKEAFMNADSDPDGMITEDE